MNFRNSGIPTNFSHTKPQHSQQTQRRQSLNLSSNKSNPYGHIQRQSSFKNNNKYNQNFQNPYPQQNFSQPDDSQEERRSNLAKNIIMNYADGLFKKFDKNNSGYLDVREMYNCVGELYRLQGKQEPSYEEVIQVMRQFDDDNNGLIDKEEFRNLLLKLSNH